jgi:hypothetical protein
MERVIVSGMKPPLVAVSSMKKHEVRAPALARTTVRG